MCLERVGRMKTLAKILGTIIGWIIIFPVWLIIKLLFWWLPTEPDYGYDDYYWWNKHK